MRNNLKNASYNAFGFIFPLIIGLVTTPYIIDKLTPAIYGIYVLAMSLMGLMSFLDLGFGQGIIRFVSHYEAKKDYDKINKIIEVSLFIYLAMGLIGCILIFFLSVFLVRYLLKVSEEYVQTAILAFRIIAFGFLIKFINEVFLNIPKALQRYDLSVKIQNALWFFVTILTVILLYLGKGLTEVLIALILVHSAGLVIYYSASKKLLPWLNIKIKFDKDVFREIFRFSFFTAANSITGNIVEKIDKIIIAGFLGTAAVAFYNVPYMLARIGAAFIGAISQHLFPGVSYIHGSGNKEKLADVYKRSFRFIISLSLIITILLIVLGDSFLKLWMGQEFASRSSGILPILALVFFFSCITSVTLWFYMGLGYSHINLLSSATGSACYLLGAVFLVPKFGLYGAALSFTLILVPFPIYTYYLLKKIIGLSIRWYLNILIKGLLLLAGAFALNKNINVEGDNIFIFFITGLVVTTVSGVLLIIFKIIEKNEIFLIRKLSRGKILEHEEKI